MKTSKLSIVLALVISGCIGGAVDTSEKASVVFCSSFASVLSKLTLFRTTGNLSSDDISRINDAVVIIEPFCTDLTVVGEPTDAVLQALDILLIMQLSQGT